MGSLDSGHSQATDHLEVARSWTTPEASELECFRADGLVHEYGRHAHSTWSIGIVDRGVGGAWYRGANRHAIRGELFAIAPGEVHTGYPVGDRGLSYSILYVGDALIRDAVPNIGVSPVLPSIAIRDRTLAFRMGRLCRALEFSAPSLAIDTEPLTVLGCMFGRHGRVKTQRPAGKEPIHVIVIKEYLRAHMRRQVRLLELSDLTGLSKAYLIRSFHRIAGMPPYEWLLQLRIEAARKRLQQGCAISDLAFELGFADQSHFHRRFKRLTGMTPAAYAEGHYRPRRGAAPLAP
jgi:AraC-like DNA-binding protein